MQTLVFGPSGYVSPKPIPAHNAFTKTLQATTKSMPITVTRLIRPTVVVGNPNAGARIKVHANHSSYIYADRELYGAWTNPGGDWFDANGVFNGPTSYYATALTDNTPQVYNISAINGDIILRGIHSIASVTINGVDAGPFWCDPGGNRASALLSNYNQPVLVPNPGLGNTMTVTPFTVDAPGQTLRVDKVAGPLVLDYPTYIGPTNTPNVWELELTDDAAIAAAAARPPGGALPPGRIDYPIAYDYTYGVDPANGLKYLRSAVTLAGGGLRDISWRLPYGQSLSTVHSRYLIMIEDDVADGSVTGVKFNAGVSNETMGDSSQLIVYRVDQGVRSPEVNRGVYALVDYIYDAESGSSFPLGKYLNAQLRAGRWYSIETAVRLNSDAGVHDGYGEIWVNGHSVWSTNTALYRNDNTTLLTNFYANVYHGGLTPVTASIHYKMAKFAVSTGYIGVPQELIPTVPAWRRAVTTKDVWANVQPTSLQTLVGNANQNAMVNIWSGSAADGAGHQWFAIGGAHTSGSVGRINSVWKLDYTQAIPTWTQLHPGSDPRDFRDGYPYYGDTFTSQKLPGPRHNYYSLKFIPAGGVLDGDRLMISQQAIMGGESTAPDADFGFTFMDGFKLATNTWDVKGTWATQPGYPFGYGSPTCVDAAGDYWVLSHPNSQVVVRWSRATNTWISSGTPFGSFNFTVRAPAMIDKVRNRMVVWPWSTASQTTKTTVLLGCMDMVSKTITTHLITVPFSDDGRGPGFYWSNENGQLIHDTINDRYLLGTLWYDVLGVFRQSLFAIDPVTWDVTYLNELPEAPNNGNGMLSRLEFDASLKGALWVPAAELPVYFMPVA